ncbi:ribosome biogenesis GTPase Der [Candidatus Liberibacter americanus]|uniref:GTPase Der n=1 Tax=Candidatus Liberibacter americanus str. Sao Paulo TaxID=1261131 RepID=U6B468_9HYPH|nr:ribosome biogenesis GTPase Der [Candidatus Liberibacter americanus]AHA27433.1 GTPase [Candidatus Liberibacter americanus str. Sao Paulo]EMS36706.1 GTP-binding protein EngA [Candidatus Liberibacter americanus PW_SP]
MVYTIAIVGAPNVGKSTLFNRLVKKRMAIVGNIKGITRDRLYGIATINGLEFNIIDTAGIEEGNKSSIVKKVKDQTELAICEAHIALFVIDFKAGITPYDSLMAKFLRKKDIPIVVVANKMDTRIANSNFYDIFSLGFEDIADISAEHGSGISELYNIIIKCIKKSYPSSNIENLGYYSNTGKIDYESDHNKIVMKKKSEKISKKPIRIAVVGRPNVGKSTLINRFVGHNRLVSAAETGTTRDSIAVQWNWNNHLIEMIDTAGMRKSARIVERIEKLSVEKSLKSIRACETTIVVLDATVPLEKQDLQIVDSVLITGRAAVLAFNKWDMIKNRSELLQDLRKKTINNLPQVGNIRIATISGNTGEGLNDLMSSVLEINKLWKIRITTSRLNIWMKETQMKNMAPTVSGRYNNLKYITQIKSSPPSFAIFCSYPKDIPESYKRYLMNRLRIDFSLSGIPIRMSFRSSKNPYV